MNDYKCGLEWPRLEYAFMRGLPQLHSTFECPVNKEARKANISGAKTWEDLDNKAMIRKGEWEVEPFFRKATTSKGW